MYCSPDLCEHYGCYLHSLLRKNSSLHFINTCFWSSFVLNMVPYFFIFLDAVLVSAY